jgi:hypothetical protein
VRARARTQRGRPARTAANQRRTSAARGRHTSLPGTQPQRGRGTFDMTTSWVRTPHCPRPMPPARWKLVKMRRPDPRQCGQNDLTEGPTTIPSRPVPTQDAAIAVNTGAGRSPRPDVNLRQPKEAVCSHPLQRDEQLIANAVAPQPGPGPHHQPALPPVAGAQLCDRSLGQLLLLTAPLGALLVGQLLTLCRSHRSLLPLVGAPAGCGACAALTAPVWVRCSGDPGLAIGETPGSGQALSRASRSSPASGSAWVCWSSSPARS